MKNYCAALFGLFVCTFLRAQPHSAVPAHIRASSTLNRLITGGSNQSGEFIYGIPLPPGKIVGDPYINAAWQRGSILLYDHEEVFDGLPIRYDIQRNELEVKTQKGVRVVHGAKIKSFIWIDSLANVPTYFVNVREYSGGDAQPRQGFLEVLSDGKLPAFVQVLVSVKNPDYNVQMDVGKRDAEIIKKKKYYYLKGDRLQEIPGRRKEFMPLFGEHQNEIESFMKVNSLTHRHEHHLRAIFDRYNKLASD